MVKLTDAPVQITPPLLKVGVTVMVATIGNGVAFLATKDGMLPVPLLFNPIFGLSLVHVYNVPATDPVNTTGKVELPSHTVWFAG